MRDLLDWLPARTRAFPVAMVVVMLCAAALGGYLASAALHSGAHGHSPLDSVSASDATATPTLASGFELLWVGSGETTGTLSSLILLTEAQAQHGVSLLWRCLPSPSGFPTSLGINIRQDSNRYAWIGNVAQCGGAGSNYITTLHGGTIQVEVSATGPWTVRLEARRL